MNHPNLINIEYFEALDLQMKDPDRTHGFRPKQVLFTL